MKIKKGTPGPPVLWPPVLCVRLHISLLPFCILFFVFASAGEAVKEQQQILVKQSPSLFSQKVAQLKALGVTELLFVFGFSTGHVGTTTLGAADTYDQASIKRQNVFFFFERACAHIDQDRWNKNFTIEREERYFSTWYGPCLLDTQLAKISSIKKKHKNGEEGRALASSSSSSAITRSIPTRATFVDFSHVSLFFYRGMVRVLNQEGLPFLLVRVRRERRETVMSMVSYGTMTFQFMDNDWYRFHPHENIDTVVIQMDVEAWSAFSLNQKCEWVIDETEARWQRLLEIYNSSSSGSSDNTAHSVSSSRGIVGGGGIPHVNVFWQEQVHEQRDENINGEQVQEQYGLSNTQDMDALVKRVALLLGLAPAHKKHTQVLKSHAAPAKKKDEDVNRQMEEDHKGYIEAMQTNAYYTHTYTHWQEWVKIHDCC